MFLFEEVSLTLNENDVLDKLNFRIENQTIKLVLGNSGSGKTSILKLMNNLYSPTSGSILYKEKNICQYKPCELRQDVLLVFQKPVFTKGSVNDNLKNILKIRKIPYDSHKIRSYLDRLELSDDYLRYDVDELSNGERQRINLIRSVLFDPEVLLYDEPTSNLDPKLTQRVYDWFKELKNNGKTIVLVSHDVHRALKIADSVIFVYDGKVLFKGESHGFLKSRLPEIDDFLAGENG